MTTNDEGHNDMTVDKWLAEYHSLDAEAERVAGLFEAANIGEGSYADADTARFDINEQYADLARSAAAIFEAYTLERFECLQSDDEVKTDLELTCTRCSEVLCDIEHEDTLRVLVSMATDHECDAEEPVLTYDHTHTSVLDGSPAMLVSQDDTTITLVNEDGFQWTDPRAQWQSIEDNR